MQFLLTIAVAAVASLSPWSPAVHSDSLLVQAVFDGDTIAVASLGRVRLLGIDAPEIGRGLETAAPFAREARERLAALVLHRWVHLEQDGAPADVYKRRLAYVVRDDGLFVNAVLVQEGLARVSARTPLARLAELKRAEAEAQHARRGMWGAAPDSPSRYTAGSTSRGRYGAKRAAAPRTASPAAAHPSQPRANATKKKKQP